MSSIKQSIKEAREFMRDDLWREDLPPRWTLHGFWRRFLRVMDIVVHGFKENRIRLQAVSLTYSTLMSLVPLVALSLAILKGFGYDARLSTYVHESTSDMPEQFRDGVDNIMTILESTDYTQLGGIGALTFLFMAIQMLSRIEISFNSLWGVLRQRPLLARMTNYVSVIAIVPLLLLTTWSYTTSLSWSTALAEQLGLVPFIPFLALAAALGFLYLTIPNTPVRFTAAAIAGLTGSLLWHLWFRLYIIIQPGVTQYNLLYGTLASIPIFLAWLYVSWLIILTAAKIAFAIQNGSDHRPDHLLAQPDFKTRFRLILGVLTESARVHASDEPGLDMPAFARAQHIPIEVLKDVVNQCGEANLLIEAEGMAGTYVLAKSPAKINLADVFQLAVSRGADERDLGLENADAAIAGVIGESWRTLESSLGKHNLERLIATENEPLQFKETGT